MINRKLFAELSTIFPEEYPQQLSYYLNGVGKDNVLMIISFFNSKLKYDLPYLKIEALLSMWFEPSNYEFANDVYQRFKTLEKKSGYTPELIQLPSSLYLFEYAIKNIDDKVTLTMSEIHRNLLKAYLLTNDIVSEKQTICDTSTNHLTGFEKLRGLQLANLFSYHDIVNIDYYEVLVCQFIKINYLIDFLAGTDSTKKLYNEFLKYFEVTSKKEFLDMVLPLAFANISHEKRSYVDFNIELNNEYEKRVAFIEKFALTNFEEYKEVIDYCSLRDKPLYKLKEGSYRVIFELFVIEKLFKSIYFHLSKINDAMGINFKMKNFRSFYTKYFSEEYLLERVLTEAFPYMTLFNGNDFRKHFNVNNSEADYFMINENSVFLIESKDNLINANRKQSNDYSLILKELHNKLYKSEKGKNEAILQLKHNIELLLKNDSYANKDIYPIIVAYDSVMTTPGINSILTDWFQKELQSLKADGLDISKIQDITIIDIDSIILYNDFFSSKAFQLNSVIDSYKKSITPDENKIFSSRKEAEDYFFTIRVLPFRYHLSSLQENMGKRNPPAQFMKLAHALYSKQ